jgi:hypothetical protein
MMLGEESKSADYWKRCGDEALAQGIKGVVIMVSDLLGHYPLPFCFGPLSCVRMLMLLRVPTGLLLIPRALK